MLVLLVCAFTYRATRLLTLDAFPPIAWLRYEIVDRWGDDSWQSYLATCAWCVSVYVAAATTWAVDALVAGGLQAPVLVAGTASAAAGLLSAVYDPE